MPVVYRMTLAVLLMTCFSFCFAQKRMVKDQVLDESIRSVQLYKGAFEASYPVLYLRQGEQLTIEFDELIPPEVPETFFVVEIVNCDADWKETSLVPIEYFDGFSQSSIQQFRRSEYTKVPYVHYRYSFPQPGERFKRSGNFAVKVYRDNSLEDLVFTKRFLVVDPRIKIENQFMLNDQPERMEMRELAFKVSTQGLGVQNPLPDMKVRVLQNFRWDQMVTLDQPRFFGTGEYEYMLDINQIFSGGQEFRYHDIRSMRLFGESVRLIDEREDVYDVFLFRDKPRLTNTFRPYEDFNGSYLIAVQEWPDPDIHADYVFNYFQLESTSPFNEGNPYVTGIFMDWHPYPEYQMSYNPELGVYEAEILLKQGIYDYQYAFWEKGRFDAEKLEGRRLATENFYSILIYYRSPMDRTDQLLGFLPLNYIEE